MYYGCGKSFIFLVVVQCFVPPGFIIQKIRKMVQVQNYFSSNALHILHLSKSTVVFMEHLWNVFWVKSLILRRQFLKASWMTLLLILYMLSLMYIIVALTQLYQDHQLGWHTSIDILVTFLLNIFRFVCWSWPLKVATIPNGNWICNAFSKLGSYLDAQVTLIIPPSVNSQCHLEILLLLFCSSQMALKSFCDSVCGVTGEKNTSKWNFSLKKGMHGVNVDCSVIVQRLWFCREV